MRTSITILSILFTIAFSSYAQENEMLTQYEQSNFQETATYDQAMSFYRDLESQYEEIKIFEKGTTDIGLPLHVVMYDKDGVFDPQLIHQNGRVMLLINNAIHPGEPDGVSACQMFLRNIASNPDQYLAAMEKVSLAIIPFYNIGGVLNRNSTSRANQNGPKSYGFRGNAQNYDLNRDFIKSDTKNSRSFQAIFQELDPDFFLDTHVSNGADYQHVMTLDYSQKDKLGGGLGSFMDETILPFIYSNLATKGFPSIPYVNHYGTTPEKGWVQFMDWPRYSSGYAALFHTTGIMSETHMLKSYQERVESTYALIETLVDFLGKQGSELRELRELTKKDISNQEQFAVSWEVDKSTFTDLEFSGYEADFFTSELTGQRRIRYNREKPFTKTIPYYDDFKANIMVTAPSSYIIPQQWTQVIDLLKLNNIYLERLERDTTLTVQVYRIDDYKTSDRAYEGHYRHFDVKVKPEHKIVDFRKGDYIVPVNQWRNRYIVETLEPHAPDSFFNWNFFDTILQRKEYFSSYIFEDTALELLANDTVLKKEFDARKAEDPEFAKSGRAQLSFIYEHSNYSEKEYLRYPVFRLMKD